MFTTAQVARFLGCSYQSAYRLGRHLDLPHTGSGRRMGWLNDDVARAWVVHVLVPEGMAADRAVRIARELDRSDRYLVLLADGTVHGTQTAAQACALFAEQCTRVVCVPDGVRALLAAAA